jgi:hypothetical protein
VNDRSVLAGHHKVFLKPERIAEPLDGCRCHCQW